MRELEQARLFYRKAASDEALLLAALDNLKISDEVFGFHAQQAMEKLLKALLSFRRVPFRRTHDLRELIDMLADVGATLPSEFDAIDEWTPFAVQYRYEELALDVGLPLTRAQACAQVAAFRKYVDSVLPV